jgi:hypothetical protein
MPQGGYEAKSVISRFVMLQMGIMMIGRQEKGAIINGRKVKKANSEPKDRTPEGTEGEVLGSMAMPGMQPFIMQGIVVTYGYLVKFPTDPIPVFTTDHKVEEVE